MLITKIKKNQKTEWLLIQLFRFLVLCLFCLKKQLMRQKKKRARTDFIHTISYNHLMKFEFSAGGVVYKKQQTAISKQQSEVLILVGKHSGHHGWVFPKGLIGDHVEGEKKEETAMREVKEETGIEGKIEKAIKPVTYWYVWEGETIKKTVYYFVMK